MLAHRRADSLPSLYAVELARAAVARTRPSRLDNLASTPFSDSRSTPVPLPDDLGRGPGRGHAHDRADHHGHHVHGAPCRAHRKAQKAPKQNTS